MADVTVLKEKRVALKSQEPKLRNRDLAERLDISEAELISLDVGGEYVTMLNGDWKGLLKDLVKMGYVMALTRNEHCVHERKGVYENIEFYGGAHNNMGVAVNPDIDLRLFMNEWKYGFAVVMPRGESFLYSFQFFNTQGEAVHKVFSTPKSDIVAYNVLVEKYQAETQVPLQDLDRTLKEKPDEQLDSDIDVEGLQTAWRSLKDTHNFFGMLQKYGVSRTQSLRLAPEGFTQQVDNESVVKALELAANREVPIMCFLHSKGCVQIHTGTVRRLQFFGDWYNVLDPMFNLHLKMSSIAESWIVKKPTKDGIVTSLELFDADGNLIVYFFGKRKPGIPELDTWRDIVDELESVKIA